LIGLELSAEPGGIDAGSGGLLLGDVEGEARLVVLSQGIGVVVEPFAQDARLAHVDGVVELGEEIDRGGVGNRGVRGDRRRGRGEETLQQ